MRAVSAMARRLILNALSTFAILALIDILLLDISWQYYVGGLVGIILGNLLYFRRHPEVRDSYR